jgi:pimeloyl-ACP methyl ester carboxylesterase
MPGRPAVVLVHGFFGGAAHWGKVVIELDRRGYDSLHAVEIPLTSLADDAERTRRMVTRVDGPVVLAGHSYGGAVITEAGDLSNVAGLVYIAAFAPDAGESPALISRGHPAPGLANIVRDSDGYLWMKQDKFHESICQDLSRDEALAMAVTQKPALASTFGDAVTAPAWKVKPSWYQISAEDRMIHPDNQRRMAARLNPRRIVTLDAAHASLISHPSEVTDLIDAAAAEISSRP